MMERNGRAVATGGPRARGPRSASRRPRAGRSSTPCSPASTPSTVTSTPSSPCSARGREGRRRRRPGRRRRRRARPAPRRTDHGQGEHRRRRLGRPRTACPRSSDAVAPLDAPVVERMRAAGAIPFARTNLPDFGLRVHTDSTLRGLTRNPWHPDVTAGGSSGGEGQRPRQRACPRSGLGNDIGGSLRNPAHCCGIASIKPSTGRRAPRLRRCRPSRADDHVPADGRGGRDGPPGRRRPRRAARRRRPPLSATRWPPRRRWPSPPGAVLRIAVLADPPGCDTDPGIAAAIRRDRRRCWPSPATTVAELAPASFERIGDIWTGLLITDLLAAAPPPRLRDRRRRPDVPRPRR